MTMGAGFMGGAMAGGFLGDRMSIRTASARSVDRSARSKRGEFENDLAPKINTNR